jgi:hypothetical protein
VFTGQYLGLALIRMQRPMLRPHCVAQMQLIQLASRMQQPHRSCRLRVFRTMR